MLLGLEEQKLAIQITSLFNEVTMNVRDKEANQINIVGKFSI